MLADELDLDFNNRLEHGQCGIKQCIMSFSPDGMHLGCVCAWVGTPGPAMPELMLFTTEGQLLGVHKLNIDLDKLPPAYIADLAELYPLWCAWSTAGTRVSATYYMDCYPAHCLSLLEVC